MFKTGDPRPPNSGWRGGNNNRIVNLRKYAAEVREKYDLPYADPAEMLILMAMTGRDPLAEVAWNDLLAEALSRAPEGTDPKSFEYLRPSKWLDLELRCKCAQVALPYLRPKLSSTEITGDSTRPLLVEDVTTARLLATDPDVRRLFEKVTQKLAATAPPDGDS